MKSVWNMKGNNYPTLDKNLKTQVAVVGGGIAGYLTAFQLSKRGYQVSLIEANKIFEGTTVNTTAFITALPGILYEPLSRKYGLNFAKLYFNCQENAIKEYQKLVEEYQIDCNFTRLRAYLFSRGSSKKLMKEYHTLVKIGAPIHYVPKLENVNIKTTGIIALDNEATFHPLKFLNALPISFNIYEHTRIVKIDFKNKTLYTDKFKIDTDYIILSTHFPIFILPKLLPFRMYQSVSYCQAYYNSTNLNGLYVEDKENGITLRNYANYIILGGGDHRTAKFPKTSSSLKLKKLGQKLFSGSPLKYEWLAQDCMTFDSIPFISRLDEKHPNIYIITGFNKWGMTNSMVASHLITDLIMGNKNELEKVFSLNRQTIFHNPAHFLGHILTSANSLFKSFLIPSFKNYKNLKNEEGGIFIVNGKKCGVYKDESGEYHFVKGKCSHLKCELKFNKETKTFDCPCHGSKYDIDGKILYEPATKGIKLKNKKNNL